MEGYEAKVIGSSRELDKREKLMMMDTGNERKIAAMLTESEGAPLVITPMAYAVIKIHNENGKTEKNKDYTKFVVVDDAGNKFTTSSENFFDTFKGIWEVMAEDGMDEDGNFEPFQIEIYEKESKNYPGKSFLTCSLI